MRVNTIRKISQLFEYISEHHHHTMIIGECLTLKIHFDQDNYMIPINLKHH